MIVMLYFSDEEDKKIFVLFGMVIIFVVFLVMGSIMVKINVVKVMYFVLGEDWDVRLKILVGNYWGVMKGLFMFIRDDGLSVKEIWLGLWCLFVFLILMWNCVMVINECVVYLLVEFIL